MNLCGNPLVFFKLLFSTKWLVWLFQRSLFSWKASLLSGGHHSIPRGIFKRHSVYVDIWFWKRQFITGTFLEQMQSASQGPAWGLCKETGRCEPTANERPGWVWWQSCTVPAQPPGAWPRQRCSQHWPYQVGWLQLATGKAFFPLALGQGRAQKSRRQPVLLLRFLYRHWTLYASFLSLARSWCSPWSWSQHLYFCPQQVTAELKSQQAPFTLLQWSGIHGHFSLLIDPSRLWVLAESFVQILKIYEITCEC